MEFIVGRRKVKAICIEFVLLDLEHDCKNR